MRSVVYVGVAGLLAAGLFLCTARASERANLYPELLTNAAELDLPTTDVGNLHHLDRYLIFGGFDLWRNGGFGHGGLLWSPGGLERDGFTLKLLLAGGLYRYNLDRTLIVGSHVVTIRQQIVGIQELVSVMAGWRIKRGPLEATVFAGPDLQAHRLVPDDPDNPMRGIRMGVRVGGDLWYQPHPLMMVNAGVSASTIGNNYWSRVASGWHFSGLAWIGPEIVALGGGRYRQLRFGAHATALRLGGLEWTLGAGYVRDSDDRDGLYARFGVVGRR
jgi:hypothetical protein